MFQRLQPPVVELAVLWKKRSENWSRPIPSIGLGRQTTTSGEVVDALHRRKIDFCCAQETRWKGESARMLGANGRRSRL